jgi:hypothetical protein
MIRPFTLICMLLACGSGLYLYQTKHQVQLLDREIAQTVQATTAARDRAGVLRTEWTLLNDLERLRALADQYLQLRPVAPGQFTALADLGSRLPAPRAPQPEPVAAPDLIATAPPEPASEADTEFTDLPTPPVPPSAPPPQTQIASAQNASAASPAAPPPVKDAAREAAAKAAAKATAEAALARAAERRQVAEAAVRAQAVARPVTTVAASTAAAQAYRAPAYSAPATYSPPQASSLGMASRTALPPPVPVSATQYVTPN